MNRVAAAEWRFAVYRRRGLISGEIIEEIAIVR